MRRAALRLFVLAVALDRIAGRRLPLDARMLVHLLGDDGPPLDSEGGERWLKVLQGHLHGAGISIGPLAYPLTWVLEAFHGVGCGGDRGATWRWLLEELDRL